MEGKENSHKNNAHQPSLLPDIIWFHILSFLEFKDLLSVALVSHELCSYVVSAASSIALKYLNVPRRNIDNLSAEQRQTLIDDEKIQINDGFLTLKKYLVLHRPAPATTSATTMPLGWLALKQMKKSYKQRANELYTSLNTNINDIHKSFAHILDSADNSKNLVKSEPSHLFRLQMAISILENGLKKENLDIITIFFPALASQKNTSNPFIIIVKAIKNILELIQNNMDINSESLEATLNRILAIFFAAAIEFKTFKTFKNMIMDAKQQKKWDDWNMIFSSYHKSQIEAFSTAIASSYNVDPSIRLLVKNILKMLISRFDWNDTKEVRAVYVVYFEKNINLTLTQSEGWEQVKLILNQAISNKKWDYVQIILQKAAFSSDQQLIIINEILNKSLAEKNWKLARIILKVAILEGDLEKVQRIVALRDRRGIPFVGINSGFGNHGQNSRKSALFCALTTQPRNKDIIQTLLNLRDFTNNPILNINHCEFDGLPAFSYVMSNSFQGSLKEKIKFFKMIVDEVRGAYGEFIAEINIGSSPLLWRALELKDLHFLKMLLDLREVSGHRTVKINALHHGETALDHALGMPNCDLEIINVIKKEGGKKAEDLPKNQVKKKMERKKREKREKREKYNIPIDNDVQNKTLEASIERLEFLYNEKANIDDVKNEIRICMNEYALEEKQKNIVMQCINKIESMNRVHGILKNPINLLIWVWKGVLDEHLPNQHFWLDKRTVKERKLFFIESIIDYADILLDSRENNDFLLNVEIISILKDSRTDIIFSDSYRKLETIAVKLLQFAIVRRLITKNHKNTINKIKSNDAWKEFINNKKHSVLMLFLHSYNGYFASVFDFSDFKKICKKSFFLLKHVEVIDMIKNSTINDFNLPKKFKPQIESIKNFVKENFSKGKEKINEENENENLSLEKKLEAAAAQFEKNAQSAHASEVVVTVTNSIMKLKECYPSYDKEKNLEALGEYINHLSEKGDKEKLEKDTALQYLNSIKENNFKDTDTDLTLSDIVALVWEGIIDNTEQARPQDVPQLTAEYIEIRKSALVERLVANQTMYHDSSKETICFKGALNNIVDALDKAHPAVVITKGQGLAVCRALDMLPHLILNALLKMPIIEQRRILFRWNEQNLLEVSLRVSQSKEKRQEILDILDDKNSIVMQFKKKAAGEIENELEKIFGSVVLSVSQRRSIVREYADFAMPIVHKELEVVIQLINEISTESASPHKKEAIERLQGLAKDAYGERDRSFQEEYEFLFAKYKDFRENFDTLEQYANVILEIEKDNEENSLRLAFF